MLFIAILSVVSLALYSLTLTSFGWNQWLLVAVNVIFFGLFVATLQFRKKMARLPGSIYLAFTVAFFAEMFGLPLTMYVFMGVFGYNEICCFRSVISVPTDNTSVSPFACRNAFLTI